MKDQPTKQTFVSEVKGTELSTEHVDLLPVKNCGRFYQEEESKFNVHLVIWPCAALFIIIVVTIVASWIRHKQLQRLNRNREHNTNTTPTQHKQGSTTNTGKHEE